MKHVTSFIILIFFAVTMKAQQSIRLSKDNISDVIGAMTLEEKAQMLVGGGNLGFAGSGPMVGSQKNLVPGAAGTTVGIPRLGIPQTVLSDGPAGVRIDVEREGSSKRYYATGFPVGTCLACTWNTDLVEQVGKAIGNETLEYGCDVILGPGLNIHRNPLCGRNFEYYSEDPYVTGAIGTACVKGIQSEGVGVSIKHYAVNSQESDRTRVDERLSQRALREIYLRGFEKVVREADPWTVMSSYNKVNGTYSMGHRQLLTDILRNEWGYKGIVMTDWIGKRPDLPTEQEVSAGNDLMMPGYAEQARDIVEAVKAGRLSMDEVDRNVRRMLEYIVKTPHFRSYAYSDNPDIDAHAQITRMSSAEGMVLLKNSANVLPLTGVRTVALFGVNSYDFMSGGLGSGCVNVKKVVDMVTGLKNNGISTTPALTEIYNKYIDYAKLKLKVDKNPAMWFLDYGQPKLEEIEISERCIDHELPLADAAIITIGRQAGEGMDRSIEGDFCLTDMELRMIHRVSAAFHAQGKPVVVIINSGSVVEVASWRDYVDAILMAWQPGQEGGNSVADVLTGKVNPSGKLTMTIPVAATDHPSTANFPQYMDMYSYKNELTYNYGNIKGMDYTNHDEGIYVGYRYFDTNGKAVAYPFGYGLSYTSFQMTKPSVKALQRKDGEKAYEVSVVVTNTGNCEGKEVAQVYVSAPGKTMDKPRKELKAFGKTPLLKPGESTTLRMTVKESDLQSFDEQADQWQLEKGQYTFHIATSVADVKHSINVNIK